jgi:ADP-heptose:LPS heptosyltransferase
VQSLGTRVRDTRLAFPVRDDARRSMLARAAAAGMESDRAWLIVHPGATAASRRYPHDRLADAVGRLQKRGRWQIAIAGADEDRDCAQRIAASVKDVVLLTGVLDLAELAALLEAAELVVRNNSAPAHLAAAVGTPVVDLYALTNPQHTPWGVAHRVLSHDVDCKYCLKSVCPQGHHRCLADVAPGEIVAAVDALLPDVPLRAVPRLRAFAGAGAGA